MADLNDFFAKKDKKKHKNKYTTINDIDQKLRQMDTKKDKVEILLPDDEWNIFEEKKIDYTGLKILDMNLEEEEDGDESGKEDESQCPWSSVTETQESLIAEEEKPAEKETKGWKTIEAPVRQEKPTPTVKTYIPPHLRNRQATTATTTTTISSKVKGNPGNTKDMFPSLPTSRSANIW